MSTDDLARRAKARAAHWPMTETSALLSELADEVDQLQGLVTHLKGEGRESGAWETMRAERAAARAALERVRAVHVSRPYDYARDLVTFGQTEFPDKCTGCRDDYPCETARALEGES